jgi:hypothetical protein
LVVAGVERYGDLYASDGSDDLADRVSDQVAAKEIMKNEMSPRVTRKIWLGREYSKTTTLTWSRSPPFPEDRA